MKTILLRNFPFVTVLLVAAAALAQDKVPLKTTLPRPLFVGTPVPLNVPNLEPPMKGKRPDFMVPAGTIKMSEDPAICAIYREARADAVSWDDLTQKGYVRAKPASAGDATRVDVRETAQLAEYEIPVFFNKPPHQPHLENFFNAIRGTAKLNCPGDEAFSSEYVIHKANEAVNAEKKIPISSEEVKA